MLAVSEAAALGAVAAVWWVSHEAADAALQHAWEWSLAHGGDALSNPGFTATTTIFAWFASCVYFTYLDLTRSTTKVQRDYWPSKREMAEVAVPQIVGYSLLIAATWLHWWYCPSHRITLPERAPTTLELVWQITVTLIVGDFLIYWEHRWMHAVPWLRNNIHSVHHKYTAPFSWAGGIVHPLEVFVVVAAQGLPAAIFCHPLAQWIFSVIWTVLLIDEHSGHDVWWSPWRWLLLRDRRYGGGATPHDVHHYMPTKNFSFCLCIWDQLFGSYIAPTDPRCVNPWVPPLCKERREAQPAPALRRVDTELSGQASSADTESDGATAEAESVDCGTAPHAASAAPLRRR
eukprot:TRINITY_DN21399_c0_g1_i1.p1 TRINITY_DN21399_c0_g1~~TRINITY_DN21399_c0_g1_i1.p1  ORF type:complete len:346 (+),score=80.11 TRINITY_DN21399_c0_g1_i1:73-1110(+)